MGLVDKIIKGRGEETGAGVVLLLLISLFAVQGWTLPARTHTRKGHPPGPHGFMISLLTTYCVRPRRGNPVKADGEVVGGFLELNVLDMET